MTHLNHDLYVWKLCDIARKTIACAFYRTDLYTITVLWKLCESIEKKHMYD